MANGKEDSGPDPSADNARDALLTSVLGLSGDRGYRQLTVEEVVSASGTTQERFRELFVNLDDCYATAYEGWTEVFWQRLQSACEEEDSWPSRIRAAVEWMVHYVKDEPDIARGAIAEAPITGMRVQAARRDLLERLSRAVDSARRETDLSRHSPPPSTAPFIVGGIAWSVECALKNPAEEPLELRAADLVFFAVRPYFGEEAALVERSRLEARL
ncbi:MAG TPA: hypothetical protein VNC16_13250 [Solirubrobacterales bacterium]|jgi:AcrR family transcriptional regulator|nr:hypothetical protein [Solirubrobacterales bacterium]